MDAPLPTSGTSTAVRRRPFYRLHASTWFLLLPALAILVLLVVPGLIDRHGQRTAFGFRTTGETAGVYSDHGWPWQFLRRELLSQATIDKAFSTAIWNGNAMSFPPGTPADALLTAIANNEPREGRPDWLHGYAWWGPGESREWRLGWLSADFAICLLVLMVVAAPLEWRRRRHARAWQFSLGELACVIALIAGGLAWWRANVDGSRVQISMSDLQNAQISLPNNEVSIYAATGYESPEWLRRLCGIDHTGICGRTTTLTVRRWDFPDPPAELSGFRALTSVKIKRVSDAFSLVEWLAGQRKLTEIDVCPITHDGIEALCRTGRLTGLDLGDYVAVQVTDADLEWLIHSPRLRKLDLSYSQVTDDGLRRVAALAELEELNLESTHITDVGLARLSSLKKLTRLKLAQSRITDEGLRAVGDLTSLTDVDLEDSPLVTSEGMQFLAWLPNLESLNVKDTAVKDAGLEQLVQIKSLKELRLRSDQISPNTQRKLESAWSGKLIVN